MITLTSVKFTKMLGGRASAVCIPLCKTLSKESVWAREWNKKKHHSKLEENEMQHKSTYKHLTAQRGWYGPWRPALITSGNTNQSVFHHLKLELLASSSMLFPLPSSKTPPWTDLHYLLLLLTSAVCSRPYFNYPLCKTVLSEYIGVPKFWYTYWSGYRSNFSVAGSWPNSCSDLSSPPSTEQLILCHQSQGCYKESLLQPTAQRDTAWTCHVLAGCCGQSRIPNP